MQAWVVDGDSVGESMVVFMPDDTTPEDVQREWECEGERRPEWDQYAPEMPAEVLLAAGWWLRCAGCGHTLFVEGCEECDSECGTYPGMLFSGEDAYCQQECWIEEVRRTRAYQRRKKRGEREGAAAVLSRWPDATVRRVDPLSLGWERWGVDFLLPGLRFPLRLEGETGKSTAKLLVAHGDLEAWARRTEP